MGPYARGGPSLLKDEYTAGERKVEEEDGLRGGEADGRQMQGLLRSDRTGWRWGGHRSLLNGNFSQLPAEIALTRSQSTQTNRNARQMLVPHSDTHTHFVVSIKWSVFHPDTWNCTELQVVEGIKSSSTCGETEIVLLKGRWEPSHCRSTIHTAAQP